MLAPQLESKSTARSALGKAGICLSATCSLPGSSELEIKAGKSQRDFGSKPRVARNELPWVTVRKASATPTGLWPHPSRTQATTPLGLATSVRPAPRVARSSQPWAGGHNPFGIADPSKVRPSSGAATLQSQAVCASSLTLQNQTPPRPGRLHLICIVGGAERGQELLRFDGQLALPGEILRSDSMASQEVLVAQPPTHRSVAAGHRPSP
jgi:hypothetical protein